MSDPGTDPACVERAWGFIEHGKFVPLPKRPMANLGPPPFIVQLPSGELRQIVEEPVA